MIAGFIGKMGCLPKGTKVMTSQGALPIEDVDDVLSYDYDGKIVVMPCGVLRTEKVPYEVTFADGTSVSCSAEHQWFIEGFGLVKTEKLKVGDHILSFHEQRPRRKQKPLVENATRRRDTAPLSRREAGDYEPSKKIRGFTSLYHSQAQESWCNAQDEQRTSSYRQGASLVQITTARARRATKRKEQPCLQAWAHGRTEEEQERILVDSETGEAVGVLVMRSKENEQELRLSDTSLGREQHEQLSRQLGCAVSVVSRERPFIKEILSVKRASEEAVEMYDLVVPNTNNFILENGLLSHNSGKTLSMVREALKYHARGFKIYSNFHLEIPYEPLSLKEIFRMAEEQESLENVVLLLDEIHILLDSRSGMKKVNKVVTFWLNQTRKMGVKLFYTTQYVHQVDKRLRSGTNFFIFCDGFKYLRRVELGYEEHFVCSNFITDGDNGRREYFLGTNFFAFYDTNEIIDFLEDEGEAG